jgi:adenosylhomocysteinase
VHAWYGQDNQGFYDCIDRTLDFKPTLTLDDGADLIYRVHSKFPELSGGIIGGTEETTTGVHRLRAMADAGELLYPVIAVNDAETKRDFDNVHGTGQSTIDGIIRATSVLLAGKVFIVAGYGHCGRGLAIRARGLGANVVVTEINPICAASSIFMTLNPSIVAFKAQIGFISVTTTFAPQTHALIANPLPQ